jgi:hypothetical protein
MPFEALVIRVLIASPSDTSADRRVVREALEDWNSLNSEEHGVMLLPLLWERDATPQMGDRPQGIINRQLVDTADVLVGIFWTRLGTPTSEAASGTAEEINRFIEASKPVLLYFSSQPVTPESVDPEQYAKLTDFRSTMQSSGLIDGYVSADDLRYKVTAALTRTIRDRFGRTTSDRIDEVSSASSGPSASLLARIEKEREMSGFSTTGRPRYSNRYHLSILNRGTVAAENLSFDFEGPDGTDEERLPAVIADDAMVGRLVPDGSVEYALVLAMGMVTQWDIILRWSEAGVEYEDRQTLRA